MVEAMVQMDDCNECSREFESGDEVAGCEFLVVVMNGSEAAGDDGVEATEGGTCGIHGRLDGVEMDMVPGSSCL
jgi:hypothetical protein